MTGSLRGSWHAAVAGFCALALQIISFKLISVSGMGDAISVAISLTAFVSISGIGALYGDSMIHGKARIAEMLLGVYAGSLFLFVWWIGVGSITALWSGYSSWVITLIMILVISPMAFISGMLIPAYEYRNTKGSGSNFIPVYIIFHLGGALALIILEVYASRTLGWVWVGVLLGASAMINGFAVKDSGRAVLQFRSSFSWGRKSTVLFAISIVTGFAGMASYKAVDYLVGPNIRNYALMTSAIFIGLGISGLWAKKSSIEFRNMIGISGLGVISLCVLSLMLPGLMTNAASLNPSPWLIYGATIGVVGVIVYSLIGLSIPVAVRSGMPGSMALLVVSIGNAAGYWLYVALGFLNIDAYLILASGLVMILAARNTPISIIGIPLLCVYLLMPSASVSLHHTILSSGAIALEKVLNPEGERRYSVDFPGSWNSWAWPVDVLRISGLENEYNSENSREKLIIGGMHSLTLTNKKRTVFSESASALIPAAFSKSYRNALVIGAGTGVSAGAIARVFERTDVVDISPDTNAILTYFSEFNQLDRYPVNVVNKDALSYFHQSGLDKYDFIFSTVTGAGYAFSSMLYTQEFFSMAQSAMTDDGVFSFWMDYRIGREGASSVLAAVDEVFSHREVRLVRSKSSVRPYEMPYIVIIASNAKLEYKNDKSSEIAEIISIMESDSDDSEVKLKSMNAIMSSRMVYICEQENATPASMARLSFAYDYDTQLHENQYFFLPFPSEEIIQNTCINQKITEMKNDQ